MHMFKKEVNLMGGHGIVGAQIPMGAGIAFAEKYKKTGNVFFTSFGDGAARQGALHETFNMAMKWMLPCIFIIENNNYAMGTSVERTTNVMELSEIGNSYRMPSETVDGMEVEAVHEAIERAAKRARSGGGPTLLDIRTYRYKVIRCLTLKNTGQNKRWRSTRMRIQSKSIETILKNKFATKSQIDKIQEK